MSEHEFGSYFSRPAKLRRTAPGRINLIGEHLDYNGGHVLPIALELRVGVQVARNERHLRIASSRTPAGSPVVVEIDSLQPGSVAGWPAYVAGVAWGLREAGFAVGGADVLVDSDLPSGAGLSSSAALECATALALLDVWGVLRPAALEIALVAQRAENEFVGVPCGLMDQAASMLSRAQHALLLDCRELLVRHIPFDLQSAGLALLVIDTRVRHALADGEFAVRRAQCEEAARILAVDQLRSIMPEELTPLFARLPDDLQRRVRHVVYEERRVHEVVRLLQAQRIEEIGPLLTASHASLRDDYEVSCVELDLAVEAACAAGALGARLTGAGFGGSAIALVHTVAAEGVAAAVETAFRLEDLAVPATRVIKSAASGAEKSE